MVGQGVVFHTSSAPSTKNPSKMVEDDASSSGVMVELVSVAKGIVEQNKRTTIATLALFVVMIRARQVLL
jgi:hypothetical protein